MSNINVLTSSEITQMIDSDNDIVRKYGIIAAKKLYDKYPQIINDAVNSQDFDIREFSKQVIEVECEFNRFMDNETSSIS